jgi:hypothetical protein
MKERGQTGNHLRRWPGITGGDFSTGELGKFQPALTREKKVCKNPYSAVRFRPAPPRVSPQPSFECSRHSPLANFYSHFVAMFAPFLHRHALGRSPSDVSVDQIVTGRPRRKHITTLCGAPSSCAAILDRAQSQRPARTSGLIRPLARPGSLVYLPHPRRDCSFDLLHVVPPILPTGTPPSVDGRRPKAEDYLVLRGSGNRFDLG